ncbi:MAG: nucleotidyl transferase AbiEii/AbiGii toxin family protein [Planctomycetota bacterium]|nr:MAG: nucleotidyl transferase AbiEii/AbiGii toxin family protein [Planctomycetota bacterium]
MKLQFLDLPVEERRIYMQEAAARRDISPIVMEKDFWVCWLLRLLFESEFASHLVFKGGTSLSKVYGIINRFSEDIDLSLSPCFLDLPDPPELKASRRQRDKWMKEAEQKCGEVVRDRLAPVLEKTVSETLGQPDGNWLEFVQDPTSNSPVLLFHYPTIQDAGYEYLARTVKLELGSLTDQQPTGSHPIRPWVAEELSGAFSDWKCENIVTLDLARSFWEKATILHTEYHRPIDKLTPDRYSRHYADTAALAKSQAGQIALAQRDVRDQVIAWKSHFFSRPWAQYEQAQSGVFRLVPPEFRMEDLRKDYQKMQNMYLTEPASFDEIIKTLENLESKINTR